MAKVKLFTSRDASAALGYIRSQMHDNVKGAKNEAKAKLAIDKSIGTFKINDVKDATAKNWVVAMRTKHGGLHLHFDNKKFMRSPKLSSKIATGMI